MPRKDKEITNKQDVWGCVVPLPYPKWKWMNQDELGHRRDEPGLGRKPRRDERLRTGVNST